MVIKKVPTNLSEALEWLQAERAYVKFDSNSVIVSTDWGDLPLRTSWFTTEGTTLLEAIEKQYNYHNAEILDPMPVKLKEPNHDDCQPRSSMRHPLDMG
jgi:hypothetical protein